MTVRIGVFVPHSHRDVVLDALHDAGAGRIGDGRYDRCASWWEVEGQWRPGVGAEPFDGVIGQVSRGQEVKIEVVCAEEFVSAAVAAARSAHPYEVAVIEVIELREV
jgi:hypothetical protein